MDEHGSLIRQFHYLREQVSNIQAQLDDAPDDVDLQTQLDDQNQLLSDNLSQLQGYVPDSPQQNPNP